MATGGEGDEGQMQLGYVSRVWGTGRVTVCPPGPGDPEIECRGHTAQYQIRMNFIKVGLEVTVRKMSLNHHQYLDDGVSLETRRRW